MKRYLIIIILILLLIVGAILLFMMLCAENLTEPSVWETEAPSNPTESEPTETLQTAPPVQLPEPEEGDFVRIVDYIPNIRVELAYATVDNFTGYRIYDFTDAYLRYGTVKKLMEVSAELEKLGIGLVIWDAFRPVAAQARLWEACPDPAFVSKPGTGRQTHCRGNTVDISIYDLKTGKDLPVPTGFDNFTAYADRDYSDCSATAAQNALLLEQTMEEYGFKPYFKEWWHFEDANNYPIAEFFNPTVPVLWSANCNEFITLRDAPDGKLLTKIPKDAVMELYSWNGKYAKVCYDGKVGYVLTNYILPEDVNYFSNHLPVVIPTALYTYDQMQEDLLKMEDRYAGARSVSTIGTTEQGRSIPVIRIGSIRARYHVLLQGAVHGREHMTAWLLMAMADYWLENNILSYGDVCYHIIPMVNPDGVTISQTGMLNDTQYEIYLRDRANGYTSQTQKDYAVLWKANGVGIDINRNFLSGWDTANGRAEPSSQQYRGEKPYSAIEAAALRDYTLQFAFDATISYHSSGSLIYYAYGNKKEVNERTRSFATSIKEISGYPLAGSSGVVGAGYKDWAIDALEIPSLTIEIGCGESPLSQQEIYSIFVRNYCVLPATARWIQMTLDK